MSSADTSVRASSDNEARLARAARVVQLYEYADSPPAHPAPMRRLRATVG